MRFKNIFAAIMLTGICTSATAQFASTSNASTSNTSTDGWKSVYVQYNPITIDPDKGDGIDMSGISVGVNKAFSISQNLPLFVEVGGKLTYSWGDFKGGMIGGGFDDWEDYWEEEDDWEDYWEDIYDDYLGNDEYSDKTEYNLLTLSIPVNLTYVYAIPNSEISIAPFAGIDLKYHILGNVKSGSFDKSLFSDEAELLYGKTKRFNIGWQVGANVNFKKAYLGISYGSDFTEIQKKCKMKTTSITLGYKF